ncbi:MAG TPA: hypothetical protein VN083_03750, partial [Vicinamibacteria bacterium]|nr:hypothetical protein [Vicinamibacteria bacterium]
SGLQGTECIDRLETAFIESGSAEDLDAACVSRIRRRPFPLKPPETRVVSLPPGEMARLAGRYVSEGAPIEARISVDGPRLRLEVSDGTKRILVPASPTRFRVVGELGTFVVFELEEKGARRLLVEEGGETTLTLRASGR